MPVNSVVTVSLVAVAMVAVVPDWPAKMSTCSGVLSVRPMTTASRKMQVARTSSMAKPMAAPAAVARRGLRRGPP